MQQLILKLSHIRLERLLFWCECALLATAITAYTYFTAMSVIHVVLRQELAVSIQSTESHLSELEAEYLAGASMLSESMVEEVGLVELASVTYVSVEPDGGRLTRRP